jgi:putative flavoprotein involved in K+ transport
MAVADVVDFITDYAGIVGAPVRTGVTVRSVRAARAGFEVETDHDLWRACSVVLATGACNRAVVPAVAGGVPAPIAQVTPMTYRGAGELPEGGVLVVGASATGCQLAQEIHRSGRPVTISVGEHVRMPRTHRGRDVFWWMDRAGILDERHDEVDDITRARHVPSPQLVGTPERATLDLNALRAEGVRIVGRLGRIVDGVAQLSGSLANVCALADLKMNRLLRRLDTWATAAGIDVEVDPTGGLGPTQVDRSPALELDLRRGEIRTILWATGYRPDHSWLDIPVLDRRGGVRHDGGVVTDAPGLYLLGMPFLRRRASTFIHGASRDTEELGAHLHAFLGGATAGDGPQALSGTRR